MGSVDKNSVDVENNPIFSAFSFEDNPASSSGLIQTLIAFVTFEESILLPTILNIIISSQVSVLLLMRSRG